MIRFAVFDLDGTLVDSQRDLANAANALILELGGAPLAVERVAGMVGDGAALLVRRVLSAAGLDPVTPGALARFLELYDDRLVEHTAAYDGIVDTLQALSARMPLAVLTNKPQRATDRLLAALQLSAFFRAVIGGDTPLGRKPSPEGLLRLCNQVQAPASATVMIGDSRVDLETARNAGTQLLLVRYGFGFRFAPDELLGVSVADSPADIPRFTGSPSA
jgi:phosphoglycolate phosphatase